MSVMNVLVVVLTVLVVIQSILLLLLFRQVGSLLLARVDVIAAEGPAIGSLLTEQMAKTAGFQRHRANGQRTLLLLTRRGCGACEAALRALPGWLTERERKPALLASGDGMLDLDSASRMRLKTMGMIEHEALEALTVLGVHMTPFAFLLDAEGRVLAKGILSREEHLQQLESQAQEQEIALGTTEGRRT